MLIDRTIEPILALPRTIKRLIVLSLDAALCVFTVWLAFYLREGIWVPLSGRGWPAAAASLTIALPIFVTFGLYRAIFRYVSWQALSTIVQAVLLYGVLYAAVLTAFGFEGVPRTVGIIQPALLLIAVGASRGVGRYWLGGRYRNRLRRNERKNVLIFGAGSAGRQLAGAISDSAQMRVVGFVDNDRGLHGSVLSGIKVFDADRMATIVDRHDVAEVLLAIPSTTRQRRNEIIQLIRSTGAAVRTLPGLLDIAHGHVTTSDLQPLEIEDLLGREAVAPDAALLGRAIRGKVVMVTGAGGSIGSELCRQIAAMRPRQLLLVEASEYALYAIHADLERIAENEEGVAVELVPLLASVCDEARMRRIFAACRPDTVYHAAAYKHVPLVEHNLIEGIRNNVVGTLLCATCARDAGVFDFVLISTDKAVRPTNVMGASKRLAEMVLQAMAEQGGGTRFAMVRFGNVLDSSGSVVPLFRNQIAAGGPVTVTHREITRYFMTIPEAAQLVLQAGTMAKGGEVFVLDMGEPVRVADLAAKMIELSGLTIRDQSRPDGDVAIAFTGLRPGEKLYEELLIGNNPAATDHPRVMMANESFLPPEELFPALDSLCDALRDQDVAGALRKLSALVPEYAAAREIVDWLFVAERPKPVSRADPAPAPDAASSPDSASRAGDSP